jgi:hypothetical protein
MQSVRFQRQLNVEVPGIGNTSGGRAKSHGKAVWHAVAHNVINRW